MFTNNKGFGLCQAEPFDLNVSQHSGLPEVASNKCARKKSIFHSEIPLALAVMSHLHHLKLVVHQLLTKSRSTDTTSAFMFFEWCSASLEMAAGSMLQLRLLPLVYEIDCRCADGCHSTPAAFHFLALTKFLPPPLPHTHMQKRRRGGVRKMKPKLIKWCIMHIQDATIKNGHWGSPVMAFK